MAVQPVDLAGQVVGSVKGDSQPYMRDSKLADNFFHFFFNLICPQRLDQRMITE